MHYTPLPPPVPKPILDKGCDHKFVLKDTVYSKHCVFCGFTFKRVDFYFCEKCLYEREVERVKDLVDTPYWYKI